MKEKLLLTFRLKPMTAGSSRCMIFWVRRMSCFTFTSGTTLLGAQDKDASYRGKFDAMGAASEKFGSPRARSQRLLVVHDKTRPKANGNLRKGGMLPPPNVHNTDPNRVWNPIGKNPGDVVTPAERERTLMDFFNSKGSGGNPGHGIQGSTLGSTHASGKNPGDFWRINTKPFKGAHFAVYPEELCMKPILSSSRIGDVILDPFIGSGTTAVVAKKFGRRFIFKK